MPRGKILTGREKKEDYDFRMVDDFKLRLSLESMADKISERERDIVYSYYTSPQVIKLYSDIRTSGIYESGSKDKARRKILDIPLRVYDFLDTVMSTLYGPDWIKDKKALHHELVRPWWTVSRL